VEKIAKLFRLVVRGIAIAAGVAILASVSPSPAQAGFRTSCWDPGNDGRKYMYICADIVGNALWFQASTAIRIGPDATTATGCKVTTWLTLTSLSDPDEEETPPGSRWDSPKKTTDCSWVLRQGHCVLVAQAVEQGFCGMSGLCGGG
jgi:hypothetical protein